MWRRCVGAVSLLAVVGVTVAGCASTPTPAAAVPPAASVRASASASATPSAPRSGSPSVSPSPSPTPRPSATPFLSAATEAGAYAFVKAYFAELDRAYATGDVSRLAPYREATCSCIHGEKNIVAYYRSGGRLTGEHHTILDFVSGDRSPSFLRVGVSFRVDAIVNHPAHGPIAVTPALSADLFMDLVRLGDHWILRDARIKVLS